jgi:glycopeptide antibiotics resistance protein
MTAARIFVPAYPAPNRRHFAVLALLFATIAVYGSVTPLHPQRLPLAEALARFRLVLAQPLAIQSRSDWLANVLLLLPLGFCLMAMLCCDRPHWGLPALPVVLIACVTLAVFVEFAQLFFPPRVSSINDIAAQTVGGAMGALFWLLRGQRLTANARILWRDFGSRNTVHLLLPLYLFVVLVVQTLPFDFTLSPVELYHKYQEGRVHLLPFTSSGVAGFELANKLFWNAVLFAPVGLLLIHLPGRVNRSGARILVLGLSAAGAIELAQLLAVSRFFDTIDILTGGAAVFAAWYIARRFSSPLEKPTLRRTLLVACLAALVFMEWQPFQFSLSLSQARSRFHQVSLLPFVDYLEGNYIDSLDDGIHKILLFVPLGVLLAPSTPVSRGSILFRWSLAVALAVVLEMGQLFLPTRYPSFSDVLVGGAAAGIGLLVAYRRVRPPLRLPVTPSFRPTGNSFHRHGYRIVL